MSNNETQNAYEENDQFEAYFTKNLFTDFMKPQEEINTNIPLPQQNLTTDINYGLNISKFNYSKPLLQYYAFTVEKKKIKNKKTQRNFIEREGDWTCFNCKNLNFSFRKQCKRCKIPKCISDNQHENYLQSILTIIENNQMIRSKWIID